MSVLQHFYVEVIELGAEACLPRNLSDRWLQLVGESVDDILGSIEDEDATPEDELFAQSRQAEGRNSGAPSRAQLRAVGLAAVLSILRAKGAMQSELQVATEDLLRYLEEYRMELGFEEVHRVAKIQYEPASIATIFTNRTVRTRSEP